MTIRKWGGETTVTAEIFAAAPHDKLWDVAALEDGGYVVVWIDRDPAIDIARGQRYDARGVKVGLEFDIGASVSAANKIDISVTSQSNGGFAVGFTVQNNSNDTHLEIFNAAGVSGGVIAVDSQATPEQDIAVARLGTGSVFAETDTFFGTADVWLQAFDDAGVPATFFVDFTSGAAGTQRAVAVAAIEDGARVVAAWFDDNLLQYQFRIATSGLSFLTGIQVLRQVDSSGDGDFPPSIVALKDGNFAIVWHMAQPADSADTSNFGTFARVFNSSGVAISGEILVNSRTTGMQARADVTATQDGGFFVSYTDQVLGQREVMGRAFDSFGNALGPAVQINTTTAGDDQDPRLATLSDGRIIALWHSGAPGESSLRTQIIDTRDGIIFGSNNAAVEETLYGHEQINDEINGLAGIDRIFGLNGNDALYGGDGNDVLEGGKGDDFLYGGRDTDSLRGGDGDDEMYGEASNDTLVGSLGADVMDGGDGTDSADYRNAPNGVRVSLDNSFFQSGSGTWGVADTFISVETLNGSAFMDALRGDAVNNTLFGNAGADTIEGLNGNDRLVGGVGADTLTGGANNDRFDYNNLTEIGDTITDFAAVNDSIYVSAGGFGGGLSAGTLGGAQFQASVSNVATTTDVRFIFRATDHTLWFDADGSLAGAAVMVADMQPGATMTNADIIVF